jgi:hypothetical protein
MATVKDLSGNGGGRTGFGKESELDQYIIKATNWQPAAGGTSADLGGGLVKAWTQYTGVTTTAIQASLNISGVSDDGTGITTVSINSDMANDDYAIGSNSNGGHHFLSAIAAGSFTLKTANWSHSLTDYDLIGCLVAGDLA